MSSLSDYLTLLALNLGAYGICRFLLGKSSVDALTYWLDTPFIILAIVIAPLFNAIADASKSVFDTLHGYCTATFSTGLALSHSISRNLRAARAWLYRFLKAGPRSILSPNRQGHEATPTKPRVYRPPGIQSPALHRLEPFRPPDTWDAHRAIRLGFCRCSPRTLAMDPLIAAAVHNSTCSPLCSLSEEILVEIMTYAVLCPTSLQCLRRTSRVFLRLYCSKVFAPTHRLDILTLPNYQCHHWPEPCAQYHTRHFQKILSSQLHKDLEGFCGDCRASRLAPSWARRVDRLLGEQLWCSGCQKKHRRIQFSQDQRRAPRTNRVCIGREGHIRLCEHRVITWDDIRSAAKQLSLIDWELMPSVELFRCCHRSHIPVFHAPQTASFAHARDSFPSASITKLSGNRLALVLRCQSHMLVEKPCQHATTPSRLRKQLQESRKGVAEFIAPEMAPGRLPEMNCFDPNRCSCLHLEGSEHLRRWGRPLVGDLRLPSCRRDHKYYLRALQPGDVDNDPEQKGWVGGHCSQIQTTGMGNFGTSTLHLSVNPCISGHPQCLSINYKREVDISYKKTYFRAWNDTVLMSWCQAMDPDSYNLTEDHESCGVTWCRQPGCKNYYKYLRKAAAPLTSVYKPW